MDIIIIVIILVICCCCCIILGGGGYYFLQKNNDNTQSAPASDSNALTPAPTTPAPTTPAPTTPAPLQIPAPIVTDFNAPLGEYSSWCDESKKDDSNKSCNCKMEFKVLYTTTVNGVVYNSLPSDVIGIADNCFWYWNPTIYFTITNAPINISSDIKLILLTSRSGENNWYYSKAEPFKIVVSDNKIIYTGIKFSGATATFNSKYT
jgi:hypothetical protein